jgi:hypothetical protein
MAVELTPETSRVLGTSHTDGGQCEEKKYSELTVVRSV